MIKFGRKMSLRHSNRVLFSFTQEKSACEIFLPGVNLTSVFFLCLMRLKKKVHPEADSSSTRKVMGPGLPRAWAAMAIGMAIMDKDMDLETME